MTMRLLNVTQNSLLATNVLYCNRFLSRLTGLLGKPPLTEDEACWLIPCKQIHTFGMKYPIDVYFLDKNNEVAAIIKNLEPNRFSPHHRNAHSVVEFRTAKERNCNVGDKLAIKTVA